MPDNISLPFGASWLLLPGTKAAWGARLIFPDDLVHDRQGTAGDKELADLTLEWLNSKVDMVHPKKVWDPKDGWKTVIGDLVSMTVGGHARWKARQLYEIGEMTSKSKTGHVLYMDHKGAVLATPNGSYGYLYVSAYLYDALLNGCTPQSDGAELARKYGREENK